jgi:hypothetical protein
VIRYNAMQCDASTMQCDAILIRLMQCSTDTQCSACGTVRY